MSEYDGSDDVEITMTQLYKAQEVLLRGIAFTPREHQYTALEQIIMDFKPPGKSTKQWIKECQDAMIQGYINSDNVFRRAKADYKEDINQGEHDFIALYSGLNYATTHGLWTAEYQPLLFPNGRDFDEEPDPHEEGGI